MAKQVAKYIYRARHILRYFVLIFIDYLGLKIFLITYIIEISLEPLNDIISRHLKKNLNVYFSVTISNTFKDEKFSTLKLISFNCRSTIQYFALYLFQYCYLIFSWPKHTLLKLIERAFQFWHFCLSLQKKV